MTKNVIENKFWEIKPNIQTMDGINNAFVEIQLLRCIIIEESTVRFRQSVDILKPAEIVFFLSRFKLINTGCYPHLSSRILGLQQNWRNSSRVKMRKNLCFYYYTTYRWETKNVKNILKTSRALYKTTLKSVQNFIFSYLFLENS